MIRIGRVVALLLVIAVTGVGIAVAAPDGRDPSAGAGAGSIVRVVEIEGSYFVLSRRSAHVTTSR